MNIDKLEAILEEMSEYSVPEGHKETWDKVKTAADTLDYNGILSALSDNA